MQLFLLCIKIFFVRILDVSFGTVRTIITIKGKSIIASLIGFFEVLIWFLIVREALNTDVTSIWIAISYSLGFATGTYIGSIISNRFIESTLSVQIVTAKYKMVSILRENNYGVSVIHIDGKDDIVKKYMLFIEIKGKSLRNLQSLSYSVDKNSFFIVTETKFTQNGYIK